jgi:hypothetical protein
MEDTIKMLAGYGAMGLCLLYFIYKDAKLTKDTTTSLNALNTSVQSMTELVKIVKDLLIK